MLHLSANSVLQHVGRFGRKESPRTIFSDTEDRSEIKSLRSRVTSLLTWKGKVLGLCPEVRMFMIF